MKIWKKLGLIGAFIAGSLGLFNQSNAQPQTKRTQIVDVLDGKGIPNLNISLNGQNFTTNSDGYVDLTTKVKDPKDDKNKDFLNFYAQGTNANFNYNGEASLIGYNLLGQEVFRKENVQDRITWNLDKLPAGFYAYILRRKDKIEKGALISNKANVYFQKLNKNSDNQIPNSANNLEDILDNQQTLSIKDENFTSTDSVTNLGSYFDIEASYSNFDSIPSVIQMIPVLQFDSPYYKNILGFIKDMTFTRGDNYADTTKLKRFNIPTNIFYNRGQAPNQNYIDAIDSAISKNSFNSWTSITSFNYKGNLLSKMDLAKENPTDPDTGSAVDYTSNFSYVVFDKMDINTNSPIHAKIYIANNTNNSLAIIRNTKHEFGHSKGLLNHSKDPNHAMAGGGGLMISVDEGKAIRIIKSLPSLEDMSIYKED